MIFWLMLLCALFLFGVKKEYFESNIIDLDSNEKGHKYTFKDVQQMVNTHIRSLNYPASVLRIHKVKRVGPEIKIRLFIQNNKTNAVVQHEIQGKIPLHKKGVYSVEEYKILSNEEDDRLGGSIQTGTYLKINI